MNVRFEFYQPQTLQDMTVNVSTEIGSATKAAAMGALNAAPLIDAAIATDTASGSIASFSDGAEGLDLKSATIQINPKQSGSGDPSPSNVRPISGWDSIGVTRAGKNLFDPTTYTTYTSYGITRANNGDGSVSLSGTNTLTSAAGPNIQTGATEMTLLAGHTYRLSGNWNGIEPGSSTVRLDMRATPNGSPILFNETQESYTPTEDINAKLYARVAGSYAIPANTVCWPCLTVDDTDTTYEPYKATTHTLPLPSTIYGGQAVYEGNGMWTVTVDKATITFDGSNVAVMNKISGQNYFYRAVPDMAVESSDDYIGHLWADKLTTVAKRQNLETSMFGISGARSVMTSGYIYMRNTSATSVDAMNTWLQSNPVQVVYELATPQTYTLTTSDLIKTLRGTNNIWADTGDISVEYRADVGLYIDKLTGSTEDDMIADSNIPANTYFMVGNQLYRSTSAIAAGATIVPGTNCTAMTLTEALQPLIGTTETVTPQQVMQAVEEGRSVVLTASWTFGDMPLTLTFTSFNRATDNVASGGYLDIVISQTIIVVNGTWYAVELIGGTEFGTGRNWTVFATMLATD